MRNGNNYQIIVAKRQDGDGLGAPYPRPFRERGLSKHFSKVLLSAAGAELVKRPPQLMRGDRYA
jgi:hypothetical protein